MLRRSDRRRAEILLVMRCARTTPDPVNAQAYGSRYVIAALSLLLAEERWRREESWCWGLLFPGEFATPSTNQNAPTSRSRLALYPFFSLQGAVSGAAVGIPRAAAAACDDAEPAVAQLAALGRRAVSRGLRVRGPPALRQQLLFACMPYHQNPPTLLLLSRDTRRDGAPAGATRAPATRRRRPHPRPAPGHAHYWLPTSEPLSLCIGSQHSRPFPKLNYSIS